MDARRRQPTIVVLGSINMDLVAITARVPVAGETVVGQRFFTAPGGKGANQAVAVARLGARARMVGRVGRDAFGPVLKAGLEASGVDVSGVAEDAAASSGIAMIIVDAAGQNRIIAVYGANMACDQAQLEAARAALAGADALMLQLEVPLEVSLEAARYARATGVRVVWDPAPALALPPEAYRAVDVLTPNQTEATTLTGVEVVDLASARAAAEALLDMGAAAAVVKLGERGAYYASRDDSGHVPAYRVKVVDTVAAGDAFGGALTVALAEGRGLKEAVRFGAAAGALAVTRPGAQEAMPTRQEVEALMASQPG